MGSLFKQYEGVFDSVGENIEQERKTKFEFAYKPFALQDAIGERNIKKVWIEYTKLRLMGIEAEDIIHKIISKIRDMVAISRGAGKEDLGLKDYPYNKSKRDLKNWQEKDLKNFYTKIVEIHHGSRLGGDDTDLGLERAILSI